MENKAVIILGMHRSGTSMVAGVLSRLGVDMGIKSKTESPYNPLGYYENEEFQNLNKEIIQEAGGSWDSPPNKKDILAQKTKFDRRIQELIEKKISKIWGWKDPRTSLTIDLYLPYLENPYFIVCNRKKNDVADSLNRRNDMDIKEGIELKKIYDERIDKFFKEHPQVKKIDIHYEKAVERPEKTVKNIVNFLEIEVDENNYNNAINFILPNEEVHKLSRRKEILNYIKSPKKLVKKLLNLLRG